MAITVATDPDVLVIRIKFRDVYGQENTREYLVGGGSTDTQLTDIVSAIDLMSNARIIEASVRAVRLFAGMKGAAINALERKVSDALELAFDATDQVDTTKTITRSIIIPALKAAEVDLTGTPIATETNLAALIGILNSQMTYKGSDGLWYPGVFTFNVNESHQVSFADVVDTV